jgi:hypothetical protein
MTERLLLLKPEDNSEIWHKSVKIVLSKLLVLSNNIVYTPFSSLAFEEELWQYELNFLRMQSIRAIIKHCAENGLVEILDV